MKTHLNQVENQKTNLEKSVDELTLQNTTIQRQHQHELTEAYKQHANQLQHCIQEATQHGQQLHYNEKSRLEHEILTLTQSFHDLEVEFMQGIEQERFKQKELEETVKEHYERLRMTLNQLEQSQRKEEETNQLMIEMNECIKTQQGQLALLLQEQPRLKELVEER